MKCGCTAYLPMSIMDSGEYPALNAEGCRMDEAVALLKRLLSDDDVNDIAIDAAEFLAKVEGK